MSAAWRHWAGLAVAIIVGLIAQGAYKAHAYSALAPPPDASTFAGFAAHLRPDQELRVVEHMGREHLAVYGPLPPMLSLPSGKAAYLFDEHGRLVDWTPDIGDSRRLAHLQPVEGFGTTISLAEALARFGAGSQKP